jgi:hypothetical protein
MSAVTANVMPVNTLATEVKNKKVRNTKAKKEVEVVGTLVTQAVPTTVAEEKPKKTRQPKAKKEAEPVATSDAESEVSQEKPKKTRQTKAKKEAEPVATSDAESEVSQEKPKKTRQTKAKKEAEPVATSDAESEVSQEKPKKTRQPKAKKEAEPVATSDAESEVSQEKPKKTRQPKAKKEEEVSEDKPKKTRQPRGKKEDASEEESTKKPRKITLNAKYNKFLVFGYWLVENLKKNNLVESSEDILQFIQYYSTVEEQTDFYDNFVSEMKDTNKMMKKNLRTHLKSLKPKKNKKVVDPTQAAEKKRGRKKKVVDILPDKQEQLIADLVAAAQDLTLSEPEPKAEERTTPLLPATPKSDSDSQASDEIDVSVMTLNGVDYLIDQNNDVYDVNTHEPIGSFDPATNVITAAV